MTSNTQNSEHDLLTTEELAIFLRTPTATIRYWRHMNKGPQGIRVGRRVLYRRTDVEVWLAERAEPASA